MKKILQSLFAFFDNNGSRRNVSTPKSRVLRCEALEDRSLLSATAFDASSALSCAILDTDATLFVEDVEVADGAPEDAPLVIPECVLSPPTPSATPFNLIRFSFWTISILFTTLMEWAKRLWGLVGVTRLVGVEPIRRRGCR